MAVTAVHTVSLLPEPHPFLKWAGGKGQLISQFHPLFPSSKAIRQYHEPFVGSGAIYLHFFSKMGLSPIQATLSDVNEQLIDTWRIIRDRPNELVSQLSELARAYDPEDSTSYYRNRERFNAIKAESCVERSALLICLNRTCFNGLYRLNQDGGFNVPVGRYPRPRILDEKNIWAVHRALQGATIETRSFTEVLENAQEDDFVYFDPPYAPVSATSDFSSYSADGFGTSDHQILAAVFEELTRRGVRCMLSNSHTDATLQLYGDLASRHPEIAIHTVKARRAINSKPERRGAVLEILVTNYPIAR